MVAIPAYKQINVKHGVWTLKNPCLIHQITAGIHLKTRVSNMQTGLYIGIGTPYKQNGGRTVGDAIALDSKSQLVHIQRTFTASFPGTIHLRCSNGYLMDTFGISLDVTCCCSHFRKTSVWQKRRDILGNFIRALIDSAQRNVSTFTTSTPSPTNWVVLSTYYVGVLDESRSFFRVHTGYFSNIPKCIKAEFIASWACSQSSVVSSSQR
ncbi:hypothetical protein TNCV_265651 [Trichonephila clavipes]|nr:hypothetical protein TNCV_265651 [Trichonephila clavipes]